MSELVRKALQKCNRSMLITLHDIALKSPETAEKIFNMPQDVCECLANLTTDECIHIAEALDAPFFEPAIKGMDQWAKIKSLLSSGDADFARKITLIAVSKRGF